MSGKGKKDIHKKFYEHFIRKWGTNDGMREKMAWWKEKSLKFQNKLVFILLPLLVISGTLSFLTSITETLSIIPYLVTVFCILQIVFAAVLYTFANNSYMSYMIELSRSPERSTRGMSVLEKYYRWDTLPKFFILVIFVALFGSLWVLTFISTYIITFLPDFLQIVFLWTSGGGLIMTFFIALYWWIRGYLKKRTDSEVYEPDTFPIISPKSLYDFIMSFVDPLSRAKVEGVLKDVHMKEPYNLFDLLMKLVIMLHFKISETKVKKEGEPKKVELKYPDIDEELAELTKGPQITLVEQLLFEKSNEGPFLIAFRKALDRIPELFELIDRFYLALDSGEFFKPEVPDLYYDVEMTRLIKKNGIVDIFVLLLNQSANKGTKINVKCVSPKLIPEETTVTTEVNAIKPDLAQQIEAFHADLERLEAAKEKYPFRSKGKDYLDLLPKMFEEFKLLWFRSRASEIGDYPISIFLLDQDNKILQGRSINVRIERNTEAVITKLGTILGAFLTMIATILGIVVQILGL